MTESPPAAAYSLRELAVYFVKLGTLGFGGPVALIGFMQRDLVEERKWIAEADFKDGLALAQLAPGPLAAQTAMYLGYVHYGVLGASVVSVAFILPSFLMVIALGWAYRRYGGLSWMQAAFYTIGACVIGIIAQSAYKLANKSLGRDKLLWLIFAAAAVVTIRTESEYVLLFLASGLLVWFVRRPAGQTTPALLGVDPGLLAIVFLFFGKAGAFVFGSGLAIVPFLYGGVVKEYQWLNDRQFLDAVAVAMITPGPIVITVGFIGYLVAGLPGSCVAALGTFLPCYLFTVIPAPYFKRYGRRPGIAAFVDGVTAAAVGTIAGAVVVLGRRSIVDWPTAALALATTGLIAKTVPEYWIVLGAGVLGVAIGFWGSA
ncbi:MAG: chromate transporter [Elusimicrobia bacterium]|nr:chromate transporter [Elusimicrobiota bacterium]